MDNIFTILLNLAYVLAAYWILKRNNLEFLQLGSSTHAWAVVFIASLLFTIGLLLFEIPFAFFGMNDPETTEWFRSNWWFVPSVTFIFFVISLSLGFIVDYVRSRTKPEGSGRYLFPACSFVMGGVCLLVTIAWFMDAKIGPPKAADFALIAFFWGIGSLLLFASAAGMKRVVKSKNRVGRS